jgi:hypothetical protein
MVDALKQRHDYIFDAKSLGEEYEFFMQENAEKLESEYLEANDFQTSIRGIKVRGTYDTYKEAQMRGEAIKKFDKNFNVYVAQVGCWCPWSPHPEHIENVEYSETQMNTLMKKYKENQEEKNHHFRMRRDDMIYKMEQLNASNASNASNAANAANAANDAVKVVDGTHVDAATEQAIFGENVPTSSV